MYLRFCWCAGSATKRGRGAGKKGADAEDADGAAGAGQGQGGEDGPENSSAAISSILQKALLRRVNDELEPPARRPASYRSLVAPEVSAESFDASLAKAIASEESCLGSPR